MSLRFHQLKYRTSGNNSRELELEVGFWSHLSALPLWGLDVVKYIFFIFSMSK